MLAAACSAQSRPAPLSVTLITSVALKPEEIDQVKAFVKYYADLMNAPNSTPSDVERARNELVYAFVQPTSRTMSPNFRGTFSSAVVPEMETALKGKDIHRATNAALVLAHVGSDRASSALAYAADIQNQPQWQVRLEAASSVRLLLLGRTLESRRVVPVVRSLSDAASREDNGLVLRHQLGALIAADNPTVTPNDLEKVRELQTATLKSVAMRLKQANSADASNIAAIVSLVVHLRDHFPTSFTSKEQKENGDELGPTLGALLEWALAHWDDAHADPTLARAMGSLVGACEALLQRMDPIMTSRPVPATDMNAAWKAGDKAKFEVGLKAWQEVLAKAPYKA